PLRALKEAAEVEEAAVVAAEQLLAWYHRRRSIQRRLRKSSPCWSQAPADGLTKLRKPPAPVRVQSAARRLPCPPDSWQAVRSYRRAPRHPARAGQSCRSAR